MENVLVLSSCVQLVKHSLGIAWTPVEESDYLSCFIASTHYFPAYNVYRYLILFVYF